MKLVLKYYPNKINGKNHIFKQEKDVTALCGMSGYPSSWAAIPEEVAKRSVCKNCSSLRSVDHPFMITKPDLNW
jgi:hypothetical protein